MARKRKPTRRRRLQKLFPSRPKLDPRLALLLALTDKQRRALKANEDARISKSVNEIVAAVAALDRATDGERESAAARLQQLDHQLFAPLTTGLYIPAQVGREKPWPIRMKEPFLAAFILSDASAGDLRRLGVRVRSHEGDIFSAFIPLSAVATLEKSAAIRYIELSRPLFRALNQGDGVNELPTASDDVKSGTTDTIASMLL